MLPRLGLLGALAKAPPASTFAVLRTYSNAPHPAPGTHNPAPQGAPDFPRNPPIDPSPAIQIVTRERSSTEDELAPPSGALVGDPNNPNTFADDVSESLKMVDAYIPKHPEAFSTLTVEGQPKAIDLGPEKIVKPEQVEIREPTPPPNVPKREPKEGERSTGEGNTNVMEKQGKANEETAEEMHEKGP